MNPENVAALCGELAILKFFPSDQDGRTALFLLVGRMCSTEDQVRWLVQRTLAICNDWPGPKVLRQIYCSKFKPADGIAAGATESFPEGVPSEQGGMECLALRELHASQPAPRALPPGHSVSVDREMELAVQDLAKKKSL